MPKVSKASAAHQQDIGVGHVSDEIVDGYEIAFLDLDESSDMSPLLKGLPDDRCTCPHWGYVFEGSITFTFADHTETFVAGDGFYVEPSHTPKAEAGTKFVLFSPEEQSIEVNEAIQRNMAAMQSA